MRRMDRQVEKFEDMLSIIDKCGVMRIALVDNGKPYIVPLNFGYTNLNNELIIYFHCASEGRKIEIIKRNNQVCFEVDCSLKISTHPIACEWSAEYESVIGSGIIEIVDNEKEKELGMNRIMEKYGFEGKPIYDSRVFSRTLILKITVNEMVGKRNIKK